MEEDLYQYHLECSSFDCRMNQDSVITIYEVKSIEELRAKNPKCEKCDSPLSNTRPYEMGSYLPVVQIN